MSERGPYRRKPLAERFWPKVDKSGDCWLWTGATDRKGYGQISRPLPDSVAHRHVSAHRAAWELAYGEIPAGSAVLHRCDTPACVRAEHLFLGSVADNNADMVAKGRARKARGEDAGLARLTAEQVREIRTRYAAGGVTHRQLAREYGVDSHRTIGGVVRRETWRET